MWILWTLLVFFIGLAIYDLTQKKHAILRNFPIVGHLRYLIEALGPELRQYIVAGNDEERPFTRDQRRWVYASAKKQNNYFGFGTDEKVDDMPNHLIIKHSAFPIESPPPNTESYDETHAVPCAKIMGSWRGRTGSFRPQSIINISAMSFGSLSSAAIEALNRGSQVANCLHNTGEGGISPYHRHGGDLMYQIGTGYFGCRTTDGRYDHAKMIDLCAQTNVKAIEVKLSQGAKPGRGGVLPGSKVTPEIAAIRGISVGETCISPAAHTAFHDVDSLIDFIELIAEGTGLPVGIKSAVGQHRFWENLAERMATRNAGPDFIAIDGGEGGTGAAPLVFSDHVSLPFLHAFPRVYKTFAHHGLSDHIIWMGSGRLGFPERALMAFCLGCDLVGVAREAMLAIGCIQAQKCESGHCPTGVATHTPWLVRGLDPHSKSARLANYIMVLRKELLWLTRACGVPHPALVSPNCLEMLNDRFGGQSLTELFGYQEHVTTPSSEALALLASDWPPMSSFSQPY